jgi:hypothetical protein
MINRPTVRAFGICFMMFCFSVIGKEYNEVQNRWQRIIQEYRNVEIQEYMFIFLKPQATDLFCFLLSAPKGLEVGSRAA